MNTPIVIPAKAGTQARTHVAARLGLRFRGDDGLGEHTCR
jgi:hypothetical protein